ncbi:MAG: hypothetical protein RIR26_2483 [Pseudomonadota bacterium]|jgi:UDP-N-acetylmuramoyl-tripeptide--D-alanyl-D-alanine ligase
MWPKSLAELAVCLGTEAPAALAPSRVVEALETDSRKIAKDQLFVAIRGETHDGHSFIGAAFEKGAAAAVVERAWWKAHPEFQGRCFAVDDTTDALRGLAKSFRTDFRFPVIAVGGSNGKTTTKEMLSCLLGALNAPVTRTHKSENGFLGLAITLTQKAHRTSQTPAALVAEIGIDASGAMIEHVTIAQPDLALLTALGPEHLAGLGTWDNAVKEELVLFRNSPSGCKRIWQCAEPRLVEVLHEVRAGDTLVVHDEFQFAQHPTAQRLKDAKKISVLRYRIVSQKATSSNLEASWEPAAGDVISKHWSASFEIPLPGIHNAQNFALALGTAAVLCPDENNLARAWKEFIPPEMRSRILQLPQETTLYDDCYNASPASMAAAFDALLSNEWKSKHKVLVLGDMLDLGEESKSWHLQLVENLLKFENSDLCLFGTAMYDVFNEIRNKHSDVLRDANIQIRHAGPEKSPAAFLDDLSSRLAGSVVLVKGSRGMDLGRFVKSCEAWFSAQG